MCSLVHNWKHTFASVHLPSGSLFGVCLQELRKIQLFGEMNSTWKSRHYFQGPVHLVFMHFHGGSCCPSLLVSLSTRQVHLSQRIQVCATRFVPSCSSGVSSCTCRCVSGSFRSRSSAGDVTMHHSLHGLGAACHIAPPHFTDRADTQNVAACSSAWFGRVFVVFWTWAFSERDFLWPWWCCGIKA